MYDHALTKAIALYALRAGVLPRDRDVFYPSIDIHKIKEPSATGLRQWLNTWKPVILQSIKDGTRTGTTRVQSLTRMFRQIQTTLPNPTTIRGQPTTQSSSWQNPATPQLQLQLQPQQQQLRNNAPPPQSDPASADFSIPPLIDTST